MSTHYPGTSVINLSTFELARLHDSTHQKTVAHYQLFCRPSADVNVMWELQPQEMNARGQTAIFHFLCIFLSELCDDKNLACYETCFQFSNR
jgi:hypothetical protein